MQAERGLPNLPVPPGTMCDQVNQVLRKGPNALHVPFEVTCGRVRQRERAQTPAPAGDLLTEVCREFPKISVPVVVTSGRRALQLAAFGLALAAGGEAVGWQGLWAASVPPPPHCPILRGSWQADPVPSEFQGRLPHTLFLTLPSEPALPPSCCFTSGPSPAGLLHSHPQCLRDLCLPGWSPGHRGPGH